MSVRYDLSDKKSLKLLTKRIYKAHMKYARRRAPEDVEDTCQEVFTRWLEGKNQHSTIDQTVIDALRSMYVMQRRSKSEDNYQAASSLAYSICLGEVCPSSLRTYPKHHQNVFASDFERIIKTLNANERTESILRQYFQFGYKLHEIGSRLKITESRVSQIINNATDKLREKLQQRGVQSCA